MQQLLQVYTWSIKQLNSLNLWLPGLLLRLIVAWEFGEAGWAKWHGENWFADLTFPFPFNLLPPDINWAVAMTLELGGALMLILGLGTRFFAASLMVVTVVAIASVHWPEHWNTLAELWTGYRFEDVDNDGFGNYKLPVLYLFLLLPLVTAGGGRLSVDHLLARVLGKACPCHKSP